MFKKILIIAVLAVNAFSASVSLNVSQAIDIITITVDVDHADSLYAYQFYVAYDTTKLKFIRSETGNFFGDYDNIYIGRKSLYSDKILIGFSPLGDTIFSGGGTLSKIYFQRLINDTTTISIDDPIFIDSDLHSIDTITIPKYKFIELRIETSIKTNPIKINYFPKTQSQCFNILGRTIQKKTTKFNQFYINKRYK
jgi:hypothetical protein